MTRDAEAAWDDEQSEKLEALVDRLRLVLNGAPRSVRRHFVLPEAAGTKPAVVARHLYARRRARADVFGSHASVFADPAWDLLLDLFIAQDEGRLVSVTAASIGACAPATTTVRCIAKLEEHDLVSTRRHPTDRRIRLVELTPFAKELLARCLSPDV